MGIELITAQQSAESNGLSSSAQPTTTTQTCDVSESPVHYQPCDVATLTITLTQDKANHTVTLNKTRKTEPVAATVADAYCGTLSSYDLVLEALAPLKDEVTTVTDVDYRMVTQQPSPYAPPLAYPSVQPTTETKPDKDKPLTIKAKATASAVCGPDHLTTMISSQSQSIHKEGSTPVEATVHAMTGGVIADSRWGRLWPFGEDRIEHNDVIADSCGQIPSGKPITNLSAQVVVMPQDCWRITIGLNSRASGAHSMSKTYTDKTGPNKDATGLVVKHKTQRGNMTSSSSSTYIADTDYAESYSVSESSSGVFGSNTRTLSEKDSTWEDPSDLTDKTQASMRKVKVEHIIGGRKYAVDGDKIVNKILEIDDVVKEFKKLFDGIPQVGWKISFSYEILSGELFFEWGHRWPKSYVEEDRVHYVERYITVGGKCTFLKTGVEVSFGVEIDPWWLDVYFIAKIYLEIKLGLDLGLDQTVSYTNPNNVNLKADTFKLNPGASISAELGAKVGGRAFGYSLDARLALESDLKFKATAELSFKKAPTMKGDLTSKGVQLVGEIIAVGRTRRKYDFKPLEIVEKKDFFKDKVFF